MDLVPPSSRRMRTAGELLPVTLTSPAMQALWNSCLKYARRLWYIALVTPPHDILEVPDFTRRLTDELGIAEVHQIQPKDKTIFWDKPADCCASHRGCLILKAERLTAKMLGELESLQHLHNGLSRFRLVIANFSTQVLCQKSLKAWPPVLRRKFGKKHFEWPPLLRRQADIGNILEIICNQLVSRDGERKAQLAPDAIAELLRGPRLNVLNLQRRIRDGFDVMLRSEEQSITYRHLWIAENPKARQRWFNVSLSP